MRLRQHRRRRTVASGRNHKRAIQVRLFVVLLSVVVLFSGMVWLSHRPALSIDTIIVQGAIRTDYRQVEEVVRKLLAGSYLWGAFPKRFIVFVPGDEITYILQTRFPDIASVEVRRAGLRTLRVTVRERPVFAKWCGVHPTDVHECFFMDDAGRIFKRLDEESIGLSLFTFYGGVLLNDTASTASTTATGLNMGVTGTQYMARDLFERVNSFIGTLRTEGIRAHGFVYLPATNDGVLLLTPSGELRIDLRDDLERVAQDVISAYRRTFRPGAQHGVDEIEYIDARFINKVIFKFDNGAV